MTRSSLLAARSSRRGVLMLVVLSMLVLFMLIGTAFLMTSNQYRKSSKDSAKLYRLGTHADRLLDRALLHALRDTENPHSAIRYHSLLRDLYGTDGFQGVIYSPSRATAFDANPAKPAQQVTRFAGATTTPPPPNPLGPTQGQFIDIYVRALHWDGNRNVSANDPLTPEDEAAPGLAQLLQPDLRHVLKLDRNILNQPQLHSLPLTKGYYNGCLMTVTSGTAAGQSTRILEYEYVGDLADPPPSVPYVTRMFRFRVMAFSRRDGQPLQVDTSTAAPSHSPEILDLKGATFLVNGRPFNGTGAGYNPLAATGQPRLNALQRMSVGPHYVGAEVALTPNSAFLDFAAVAMLGSDPFVPNTPATDFLWLNDPNLAVVPVAQRPLAWKYQSFAGPGDVDESYDAADFQNMAIALQTVSPRSRGRVVHKVSDLPVVFDVDDPQVIDSRGDFVNTADFLRLDLENVPWPSFHRPDLVNYWYHRLFAFLTDANGYALQPNEAVAAIIHPYGRDALRGTSDDPTADIAVRDFIAAIKRKIMLRPIREDHPNFDGSNSQSVPPNLNDDNEQLAVGGQIAIPYWEAVGPWDVDNDNDGVPDSNWVDLGDPVIETEDGTRYKTLYAFLIVDLDSRLNVNAHGLVDDLVPPLLDPTRNQFFDPTQPISGGPGNLAHDTTGTAATSLQLPSGNGYGPAEISLRPLFPVPFDSTGALTFNLNRLEDTDGDGQHIANQDEPIDSYATLLAGRTRADLEAVSGKYGYLRSQSISRSVAPGTNYQYVPDPSPNSMTGEQATPDLHAQLTFFGYPWSIAQASAFGTPPDLKSRYALGIDYTGQPVYEVANDTNPNTAALPPAQRLPFNLLANSPYEIDLGGPQRRDTWAPGPRAFVQSLSQNDDAPFATSDLERVLRAWDADSGTLPSRLWDVVDTFDPVKLTEYDPYRVLAVARREFNTNNPRDPERLVTAQLLAAATRRSVTTDSYDLPVPGQNMPGYIFELGPDGAPGAVGRDDDPDGDGPLTPTGGADDASEIGIPGTDDFEAVTGTPFAKATIVDLLAYRVWLETRNWLMRLQGLSEASIAAMTDANYKTFMATVSAQVTTISGQSPQLLQDLLAPELIAGLRMNLNRPFGDGQDNPHPFTGLVDGVVDDPLEAGDPFLDINGNGKRDDGTPIGTPPQPTPVEPFIDLAGDGYTPPSDRLWEQLWPLPNGNEALAEPITFDYTNGQGEPIHPAVAAALGGSAGGARVRNLESQARQLYARHLYCLMLLLVDQDYIAPIDELDPQIATYLDMTIDKSMAKNVRQALGPIPDPNPAVNRYDQRARQVLLRKLTCRMIAQWAVNCADMRDADVIMTPFEYDENPWDGWGTRDRNGTLIPLDGDPATNENGIENLDENDLATQNVAEVIDWSAALPNGNKVISNAQTTALVTGPPSSLLQTRGVVWGAERPELLITETLAFHDRRAEDEQSADATGHDNFVNTKSGTPGNTRYKDLIDMDQGLRPWGRLFVELYNPWSQDGQLPAELYTKLDSTTSYSPKFATDPANPTISQPGITLNRLSNFAVDASGKLTLQASTTNIKRSPVWRVIVVEEWPDTRNNDFADDNPPDKRISAEYKKSLPNGVDRPIGYTFMRDELVRKWVPSAKTPIAPFYAANPDFDEVFQRSNSYSLRTKPALTGAAELKFDVAYPYVEREFYFTTDNSKTATAPVKPLRDVGDPSFRLRVPNRSIPAGAPPAGWTATNWPTRLQTQRFIAGEPNNGNNDVIIAPIMPGHYGVVGSAGTRYADLPLGSGPGVAVPANFKQSFTTTIGRYLPGSTAGVATTAQNNTRDDDHVKRLTEVRRVELRPDTNTAAGVFESAANRNQLLVTGNGGFDPQNAPTTMPAATDPTALRQKHANENYRSNELVYDPTTNSVRNINDSVDNVSGAAATDGLPDSQHYQATVAVPVDGMNISEPPWGWAPREWEAGREQTLRPEAAGISAPTYRFNEKLAYGEGRYEDGSGNPTTYDVQFDLHKPELMRTGTTANYRTIHLQRLANPLLPWNPPPTLPDGSANPEHQPNLPINLYRTVDTASVDLTAFNGVSDESNYPSPNLQFDYRQFRPWIMGGKNEQSLYRQMMLKGNFKDFVGQVWHFKSQERGAWAMLNPGAAATLPLRILWSQEPPHVDLRSHTSKTKILDRRDYTTMRVDKANIIDDNHIPNDPPKMLKDSLGIQANRLDMVLEHSLGFANETFGRLYSQKDSDWPTLAAIGAPRTYQHTDFNGDETTIESTYPWLAWNNRPLVSSNEVLQVPATSSADMLRLYSTINPVLAAANRPNPYDGSGIDNKGTPNPADDAPLTIAARMALLQAPFGHLLNFYSTAFNPAGWVVDTMDVDGDSDVDEFVFIGAPHFYRILEYVHVPSRYVGTETNLNAETFNDVPGAVDGTDPNTVGTDILGPADPRYRFQPPYNQVSRERDPGRVNLNTVTGRRAVIAGVPNIWSEVFDGIMHRYQDGPLRDSTGALLQYGHFGPAWRDVVLSRRGYVDPATPATLPPSPASPLLLTSDRTPNSVYPDIANSLLRSSFPSIFSNPFRSPDAGDLVPLADMIQSGVQVGLLRSHPYSPGDPASSIAGAGWGQDNIDDPIYYVDTNSDGVADTLVGDGMVDDAREAGVRPTGMDPGTSIAYANDQLVSSAESRIPLFSEAARNPFSDTDRNPYMKYQPMSRLDNLVTSRSNVYAIWITVGYFEVEKAPDWNDSTPAVQQSVRDRFGGDISLYNRVYPDGYMLSREVGSETGDVKRPRGFYIIDRTEEVGFKPGEDLNVERAIRLRRRIE